MTLRLKSLFAAAGVAGLAFLGVPSAVSAAGAKPEIAVVVKITGIPWFNRFEAGVKRAGDQLGVNAYQVGPTAADPAQQVKLIEDLIAKKVDAIAVVPNDAKVLAPVLKRAQDAGIVVVTHESPGQAGSSWDLETIDNREFATAVFQKLADATGGKGKFALVVGSLTVPLHNEWADIGLAFLKAKYPDLKPVADRYPVGESLDDSYKTSQEILRAHPDLKGFVAFGSQGPIGFARALERQNKTTKEITNVGNVLPKQAAPYLKKDQISEGFLWDPSDAGFGLVALAKKVIDKQPIETGIELPGLGKGTVEAAQHVVRFKATRTFTKENVDQFDF
ncbi:autoinducer 2 ABC transporter substrate-binding protein [Siculibacillus lacustris]|uniref:Autoinducer 2 ABC transporter substrate-binding protein n=1 Tax=Siculibacillus lacustris TaxID=1549641 RepID=A0A4Q9VJT3_9HYPH|nr:substrate-binding domain-containing protein [Siculibacillus lacustris]TBW35508.1 autoinducer 2 ABC transporter substrate-binding protein [Siculibacillus lacustris]